jgi:hypothetical protein
MAGVAGVGLGLTVGLGVTVTVGVLATTLEDELVTNEGREAPAAELCRASAPAAKTVGGVPPSSVFPRRKGIVQPAVLAASGSKLVMTAGFSGSICRMGRKVHFIGSSCCPSLMTSKCR